MRTIRFRSVSRAVLVLPFLFLSPGSDGLTRELDLLSSLASADAIQEESPTKGAGSADEQSAKATGELLIEVEKQKPLPHKNPESLGTTFYKPSKLEQPHLAEFKPEDLLPGNMSAANELQGRVGQQVSWFGIVREDKWVRAGGSRKEGHHELLIEHKYFDGLTDAHQQIVSFAGGGDFKAILPFDEKELSFKTLTLVRCYGEVSSEKKGVPTVNVTFVRVWPWNNFAFMGLVNEATPDRTNKRWRKRIKVPDEVYSAVPDTSYYKKLLGKRKN